MNCKQLFYDAVKTRMTITLSEFDKAVVDWDFVEFDGHCVMAQNNEIHFCRQPGKYVGRNTLSSIVTHFLNKYNTIKTKVSNDFQKGHIFALKCGFLVVGKNNFWTEYELKENKWSKNI